MATLFTLRSGAHDLDTKDVTPTPAQFSDTLTQVTLSYLQSRQFWLDLRGGDPINMTWEFADGADGTAAGPRATRHTERVRATRQAGDNSSARTSGDLDDLFALISGTEPTLLYLTGPAGAGKTTTLHLMVRKAIERRQQHNGLGATQSPIPVFVSLHGWNPASMSLASHIAVSLERDVPAMRSIEDAPRQLKQLLEQGRISLFVDGLDEVPEKSRPRCVSDLRAFDRCTMIISSRPEELQLTLRDLGDHWSQQVRLRELSVPQVLSFLERTTEETPSWSEIRQHLRTDPSGPTGLALRNPLTLSLVVDVYRDSGDVSELVDNTSFPTASSARGHILGRLALANYARRTRLEGHIAQSSTHEKRRIEWLGFVASKLDQEDEKMFLWSNVSFWVPAPVTRVIAGSYQAVLLAIATYLSLGASKMHTGDKLRVVLVWAASSAICYYVLAIIDRKLTKIPVAGMAVGITGGIWLGFVAGLRVGLDQYDSHGIAGTISIGLVIAFPLATFLGLGLVYLGFRDARTQARRRFPASLKLGGLAIPYSIAMFAVGATFGVFGTGSLQTGVLFGFIGVVTGLSGDVVLAAQSWDIAASPDHRSSLLADLKAWTVLGILSGSGGAAIYVLALDLGAFGFVVWAISTSLMALGASHAAAYGTAVLILASQGLLPFRVHRFLVEARELNVLLGSGWGYRFRHKEVRQWLAANYVEDKGADAAKNRT